MTARRRTADGGNHARTGEATPSQRLGGPLQYLFQKVCLRVFVRSYDVFDYIPLLLFLLFPLFINIRFDLKIIMISLLTSIAVHESLLEDLMYFIITLVRI